MPVDANTNTTTTAVNRDYAVPTFEALQVSGGFANASVGYVGLGQRWADDAGRDPPSDAVRLGTRRSRHAYRRSADPTGPDVNLALGFGTTEAAAVHVAHAAVGQRFAPALAAMSRDG